MDTGAMVGLMGLTFFCNKCVKVFYGFRFDKTTGNELEQTCKRAISAFKSLKWPREPDAPTVGERAIFNTNEEIESFERVITSRSQDVDEALDKLISDLEFVLGENLLEERKERAKELQGFFDTLGDCSFYAARDSLRSSSSMAGV